jgi:hypothetical protein
MKRSGFVLVAGGGLTAIALVGILVKLELQMTEPSIVPGGEAALLIAPDSSMTIVPTNCIEMKRVEVRVSSLPSGDASDLTGAKLEWQGLAEGRIQLRTPPISFNRQFDHVLIAIVGEVDGRTTQSLEEARLTDLERFGSLSGKAMVEVSSPN